MNKTWRYVFPTPLSDYRTNRVSVRDGFCPALAGIDARRTGALRRMPGLYREFDQWIETGNGAMNFAKYIQIQDATTRVQWRGFIYRRVGEAILRTLFWNPGTSAWVAGQTLFLTSSTSTIDVTTSGTFLYVTEEGSTGAIYQWSNASWTGARRLLTYQWVDPWTFGPIRTPVFDPDHCGMLTQTVAGSKIGKLFAADTLKLQRRTDGATDLLVIPMAYGVGMRLGNSVTGVWSPLATVDVSAEPGVTYPAAPTAFPYDEFFAISAQANCGYAKWTLTDEEMVKYDTIQLWRTVDGGANFFLSRSFTDPSGRLGETSGDLGTPIVKHTDKLSGDVNANISQRTGYTASEWAILSSTIDAAAILATPTDWFFYNGYDHKKYNILAAVTDATYTKLTFDAAPPVGSFTGFLRRKVATVLAWYGIDPTVSRAGVPADLTDANNPWQFHDKLTDRQLVYSTAYDWDVDESEVASTGGLIANFGGATIKTCEVDGLGRQSGGLAWSNTYQTLGVNYVLGNYHLPREMPKFHSLIGIGDYAFALSEMAVYRATRLGVSVGIQPLYQGWGPAGRYASCEVAGKLAMVTSSSLVILDPNTGGYTNVGVVDRIIQDDWVGTLSGVSLGYDAELDALVIFNPAKEEAVLVWMGTSTVTMVKDLCYQWMLCGPDLKSTKGNRVYFVKTDTATSKYMLVRFDADRSRASNSMGGFTSTTGREAGVIAGQGTASGANTVWTKAALGKAATYADWINFYLYFVSPDGTVRRKKIVAANTTQIEVSGNADCTGPGATTAYPAGTVWLVAPIVTDVMAWPLDGRMEEGPPDVFRRRKVLSVGAALDAKNPDYLTNVPAGSVLTVQTYKQLSTSPAERAVVTLNNGVDGNTGSVLTSGHFICPGATILTTGLDYEILGLTVTGELLNTDRDAA